MPAGQQDSAKWEDRLTVTLYPSAKDDAGLANISTQILNRYKGAHAIIVRTNSVRVPPQQHTEYFMAAVLGNPDLEEFGANRYVLINNVGVGLISSHRIYGKAVGNTMSQWMDTNGPTIETQLMQLDAGALFGSAHAADSLPPGTIKKGTLANAKLIQDAKTGVAGKVATMGCSKLGDVDPYVVAMPTGPAGAHQWKERWIVAGCGSHYPVDIEFKEDGKGNADWTIR